MSRSPLPTDTRAVSPVVGTVLTVALLIIVAASIGVTSMSFVDEAEEPLKQYEHRVECEKPDGSTDIPTAGLVGHYTFDNPDLGTDESGESNHGEAIGGQTTSGAGLCAGDALNPDGDGMHIEIDDFPGPDSGLTISAWIKPDDVTSSDGQRIFADDVGTGYALSLNDGGDKRLRFYNRDGSPVSLDTEQIIEKGNWYHVVAVYDADGGRRAIYVDGVEEISMSGDPSLATSGTASIGGEPEASGETMYFDGVVDEVRVYDRPLSERETGALEDQIYR